MSSGRCEARLAFGEAPCGFNWQAVRRRQKQTRDEAALRWARAGQVNTSRVVVVVVVVVRVFQCERVRGKRDSKSSRASSAAPFMATHALKGTRYRSFHFKSRVRQPPEMARDETHMFYERPVATPGCQRGLGGRKVNVRHTHPVHAEWTTWEAYADDVRIMAKKVQCSMFNVLFSKSEQSQCTRVNCITEQTLMNQLLCGLSLHIMVWKYHYEIILL